MTILSEPTCCDGWSSDDKEVDGECPICGMPTVDGIAAYGCHWSPISCDICKHRGCDLSC